MVGKTCKLPPSCPCGSKFNIQHSMSCKKGGFIYIRHNDLRDLSANMMSEVCKDTEIETKMKESFKQTMTHLHLWCFQSTVVWEESAKSFTRIWHK